MVRIAYARIPEDLAAADEGGFRFLRLMDADRIYSDSDNTFKFRNKMIRQGKPGDLVVIESFRSAADTPEDFRNFAEQLHEAGMNLISLKEDFDYSTFRGRRMLEDEAFAGYFEETDEEVIEAAPVKRRGRPRKEKTPEEDVEVKIKRGRGRPRKQPVISEEAPAEPKRRGRPRKTPVNEAERTDAEPAVKRGRGRPKKMETSVETIKKKRGRPRKDEARSAEGDASSPKRKLRSARVQAEHAAMIIGRKVGTRLTLTDEEKKQDYSISIPIAEERTTVRGRKPKKLSGRMYEKLYALLNEKKITKKEMAEVMGISFLTLKKLMDHYGDPSSRTGVES